MNSTDTHTTKRDDTTTAAHTPTPKRLRLPLKTLDDLQRELARLYRGAKSGTIAVADASRLANILQILGRLIEGADLERRIAALEANQETRH